MHFGLVPKSENIDDALESVLSKPREARAQWRVQEGTQERPQSEMEDDGNPARPRQRSVS